MKQKNSKKNIIQLVENTSSEDVFLIFFYSFLKYIKERQKTSAMSSTCCHCRTIQQDRSSFVKLPSVIEGVKANPKQCNWSRRW